MNEGSAVMNASELEVTGVRQIGLTPLQKGDARFLVSTTLKEEVYRTDFRAVSSGILVYELERVHDSESEAARFHEELTDLMRYGNLPQRLSSSLQIDINRFYASPPESARHLSGKPNIDFGAFPPQLQRRLGKRWAAYRDLCNIDDFFGFSNG